MAATAAFFAPASAKKEYAQAWIPELVLPDFANVAASNAMSTPSAHDEKRKTVRDVSIFIENGEVVSRYGSANAEFLKGYEGRDYDSGRTFKGLKEISRSRVHPEYREQNIKQQAGFSAEVNKVSRDNARNIIQGRRGQTVRTDDAPDYGVNDVRHDHVRMRAGRVVDGSGSQMKFVSNYKALANRIAMGEGGGRHDYSRYQGSPLDLPHEQVEPFKEYCREKRGNLLRKADCLEDQGKADLAAKCRQQAENFKDLEQNARDSGMTTDEAVFLREHPELGTALEMAQVAHKAGLQGACGGAMAGGLASLGVNLLALYEGSQDIEEAIGKIAGDVAKSAVTGYVGAAVGSVTKAAMQQSKSAAVRALAKTSFPGLIFSVSVDIAKTLASLGSGEIDLGKAIEELGQKGVAAYAGLWGGAVGQIAIPIPVVGAVVGGAIGYALSSLCFTESIQAIRAARLARERADALMIRSGIACRAMRQYRQQLQTIFEEHFAHVKRECVAGLTVMEKAVTVEAFSQGANRLAGALNSPVRYENFDDFQRMMAQR